MRIMGGYQDTRTNNEDFALTPFLFGIFVKKAKLVGIGICWGWWSLSIGIALSLPKQIKSFHVFS